MKLKIVLGLALLLACASFAAANDVFHEYKVLATNKTSTMEKELNEAAAAGFRFEATMGGESAFGGKEVIVVMSKTKSSPSAQKFEYKLLGTNKTSTMQKELSEAGGSGYQYKGQTVFQTAFGGKEVVVILERDREQPQRRYQYKLLATSRTGTMQTEMLEAADLGYVFVGLTVADTAFGGKEVVTVLHKQVGQ